MKKLTVTVDFMEWWKEEGIKLFIEWIKKRIEPHCTCDIENKDDECIGVTNNLQCPKHKPNQPNWEIKLLDCLAAWDVQVDKNAEYLFLNKLRDKLNELILNHKALCAVVEELAKDIERINREE